MVRVLTGFYQGFTEPKALWTLLREQERTPGRFSIRVSMDKHFHWKSYILVNKNAARVVIGSSNLTGDGLHQTGELNLVLSLSTESKGFVDLRRVYEQHWNKKSVDLTSEIAKRYEAWRKEAGLVFTRPSVPIRKILGGTRHKGGDRPYQVRKWTYCIDGHLEDETVNLLTQTTDWERRKYKFFSTWRPIFRDGDQVILFDLSDKHMEVIEVKDTTKTPGRTPDGSHFAAYRRIKGYSQRRLVPNRWKPLKAAGLLKREERHREDQQAVAGDVRPVSRSIEEILMVIEGRETPGSVALRLIEDLGVPLEVG